MTLTYSDFCRKPFVIEAVEVTDDNIAEISKFVGNLETMPDGSVFIRVDRRLVPNVFRVFPGYYMTRMGEHIRCYSKKVFFEQFAEMDPSTKEWVELINPGGK